MAQKVLVCDDDREIAAAVDIYLTAEGYEVLHFTISRALWPRG